MAEIRRGDKHCADQGMKSAACYSLAVGGRQRIAAWAKAFVVQCIGLYAGSLLIAGAAQGQTAIHRLLLVFALANFFIPGPLILMQELTKRICFSDDAVSVRSALSRRGMNLQWQHVTEVRLIRRDSAAVVLKLFGTRRGDPIWPKWYPVQIAIPASHPAFADMLVYVRLRVGDRFRED